MHILYISRFLTLSLGERKKLVEILGKTHKVSQYDPDLETRNSHDLEASIERAMAENKDLTLDEAKKKVINIRKEICEEIGIKYEDLISIYESEDFKKSLKEHDNAGNRLFMNKFGQPKYREFETAVLKRWNKNLSKLKEKNLADSKKPVIHLIFYGMKAIFDKKNYEDMLENDVWILFAKDDLDTVLSKTFERYEAYCLYRKGKREKKELRSNYIDGMKKGIEYLLESINSGSELEDSVETALKKLFKEVWEDHESVIDDLDIDDATNIHQIDAKNELKRSINEKIRVVINEYQNKILEILKTTKQYELEKSKALEKAFLGFFTEILYHTREPIFKNRCEQCIEIEKDQSIGEIVRGLVIGNSFSKSPEKNRNPAEDNGYKHQGIDNKTGMSRHI